MKKSKDRRVDIETVSASSLSLKFFFSWDRNRYGVSANAGRVVLEDTILDEDLPEPELPGKRLCEAFWAAFVDFAKGDEYYNPVFGPKPDPDARRWGRSQMTRMRLDYDAFTAVPKFN